MACVADIRDRLARLRADDTILAEDGRELLEAFDWEQSRADKASAALAEERELLDTIRWTLMRADASKPAGSVIDELLQMILDRNRHA